jgi:hypothetical protein
VRIAWAFQIFQVRRVRVRRSSELSRGPSYHGKSHLEVVEGLVIVAPCLAEEGLGIYDFGCSADLGLVPVPVYPQVCRILLIFLRMVISVSASSKVRGARIFLLSSAQRGVSSSLSLFPVSVRHMR